MWQQVLIIQGINIVYVVRNIYNMYFKVTQKIDTNAWKYKYKRKLKHLVYLVLENLTIKEMWTIKLLNYVMLLV